MSYEGWIRSVEVTCANNHAKAVADADIKMRNLENKLIALLQKLETKVDRVKKKQEEQSVNIYSNQTHIRTILESKDREIATLREENEKLKKSQQKMMMMLMGENVSL